MGDDETTMTTRIAVARTHTGASALLAVGPLASKMPTPVRPFPSPQAAVATKLLPA